jgi:nitrate reductase delta subunit
VSVARIVSLLLLYPTDETRSARLEMTAALTADSGAPARSVEAFLAGWDEPLATLQRRYVETFDFDPRASLHLTWHLYGDRRQRGVELVRLKRRYADAGLELAEGELPDYLPVLLEFAALTEPGQGRALLAELREPIELVRARLRERESPYALLLDAVIGELPRLTKAQVERIEALAAEGPPSELVGLEPHVPAAPVPSVEGGR